MVDRADHVKDTGQSLRNLEIASVLPEADG
jgi:hypothetical protein